jgi:hypothetical protein
VFSVFLSLLSHKYRNPTADIHSFCLSVSKMTAIRTHPRHVFFISLPRELLQTKICGRMCFLPLSTLWMMQNFKICMACFLSLWSLETLKMSKNQNMCSFSLFLQNHPKVQLLRQMWVLSFCRGDDQMLTSMYDGFSVSSVLVRIKVTKKFSLCSFSRLLGNDQKLFYYYLCGSSFPLCLENHQNIDMTSA